jgi:HEPN domain-containing protein
MKNRADLVQGWLKKAESDLTNARLCVSSGQSLDTACFHAQQAAEKLIKAYLIANEIEYPFIHNLEKLIDLSSIKDPSFKEIKILGGMLTPYAVELRYDEEFWPSPVTAEEALTAAEKIRNFILSRIPK